jgi:hypothetical protein
MPRQGLAHGAALRSASVSRGNKRARSYARATRHTQTQTLHADARDVHDSAGYWRRHAARPTPVDKTSASNARQRIAVQLWLHQETEHCQVLLSA